MANSENKIGFHPTQQQLEEQIRELPMIIPEVQHKKLSDILRDAEGKFKKGNFQMHNRETDRFCALGVLAFDGGMTRDDIKNHSIGVTDIYPQLFDNVYLGDRSMNLYAYITKLNDDGTSFSKIADCLEKKGY